jgi:hypothetical protein
LLKAGDIRILAAENVAGIIKRRWLTQEGRCLLEGDFEPAGLPGLVSSVLLGELAGVEAAPEGEPEKSSRPADLQAFRPREIIPGEYYLDLQKALAMFPRMTSKKILLPFFREIPFQKLTVRFDHLPPWLPQAARSSGFSCCAEEADSGGLVFVISGKRMRPPKNGSR